MTICGACKSVFSPREAMGMVTVNGQEICGECDEIRLERHRVKLVEVTVKDVLAKCSPKSKTRTEAKIEKNVKQIEGKE